MKRAAPPPPKAISTSAWPRRRCTDRSACSARSPATSGAPTHFRVGLHIGGFTQDNFLIAGVGRAEGRLERAASPAISRISYTPWKYLEAYLGAVQHARTRTRRNDRGPHRSRGDPRARRSRARPQGAAAGRRASSISALHLGVKFFNSVSGHQLRRRVDQLRASTRSRSFDLRHAEATAQRAAALPHQLRLPVRQLDRAVARRDSAATSTGNDPCIRSRVVETFAYGIGRAGCAGARRRRAAHAADNVGLEPFFEYHVDVAVGDGDDARSTRARNDPTWSPAIASTASAQQYLTFGAARAPGRRAGARRRRSTSGCRARASATARRCRRGTSSSAPPTPTIRAPGAARTKVVTKTITREMQRGAGRGQDARHRARRGDQEADRRRDHQVHNRRATPQLSADDGSFVSYGFAPGPVSLEVSRDDYERGAASTRRWRRRRDAGRGAAHRQAAGGRPGARQGRRRRRHAGRHGDGALHHAPSGAVVDAEAEGTGRLRRQAARRASTPMDVVRRRLPRQAAHDHRRRRAAADRRGRRCARSRRRRT